MRNYGQHTAVLCGLRHSRGAWVVTMDDDLQNPPEEIGKLAEAAARGPYDLVVGRYERSAIRSTGRIGSRSSAG